MEYQFKTTPYQHQSEALKRVFNSDKGHALFMDPGTGKTKIAVDSIAAFQLSGKVKRVLVLCPINALTVWPKELNNHSPVPFTSFVRPETGTIVDKVEGFNEWIESCSVPFEMPLQIAVFNYESLISRNNKAPLFDRLMKWKPDMVILDESQKIKSATAKRSKQAHKICATAKYTLLMTGTPVGKNLLDLYSQLKCINPEIWDNISWTDFKYKYGIWGGRSGYELQGYRMVDDLERRYSPYVSSARKEDCLDLPPVTDINVDVRWDPQSFASYERFSKDGMVVHKRHMIYAPIVLTKLLRLQEMTGYQVHDEEGNPVVFNENKLIHTVDLVDNLSEAGEPVIIFARFKSEIAELKKAFATPYLIKGGVTAKQRGELIDKWLKNNGDKPFIIQIQSAEALDGLQRICSKAIFYSTDYSWINYFQARGRIDREGQTKPIIFYHMCMTESIDYLVLEALKEKKDLEKMVKDNPALLVVSRASYDKIKKDKKIKEEDSINDNT